MEAKIRKPKPSITEKFLEFDRVNPQIYDLFKKFALEVAKSNRGRPEAERRRTSAHLIIYRIRFEILVRTKKTSDHWKVNNNYSALYARKFVEQYPQFLSIFEFRKRRAI